MKPKFYDLVLQDFAKWLVDYATRNNKSIDEVLTEIETNLTGGKK